jgi:hypothetical protein
VRVAKRPGEEGEGWKGRRGKKGKKETERIVLEIIKKKRIT